MHDQGREELRYQPTTVRMAGAVPRAPYYSSTGSSSGR
ncbi:hypothetical protein ABH925_006991 [Streptacidiphilus sp. EB129]